MNNDIVPVYLMPGMAANSSIFEHIKLPKNQFQIHLLEWIIPLDNESISDYAFRISKNIKPGNSVLIGVSFGGILVQEIAKHIALRKIIIVSSVKSIHELPKRMRIAKVTRAYKLIPTQLARNINVLAKYAFGSSVVKRLELYKKYLSVNNPKYLSWAIKHMICWNQEEYHPKIVHIHGDNDAVFPIKNISNCIIVKGGTHIMIITKYMWFNENLPTIIMNK